MGLVRLGRTAARHKWWFLGAWVLVVAAIFATTQLLSHGTRDEFSVPGSESAEALAVTTSEFPSFSNPSADVVFQATSGTITDGSYTDAIDQTVSNLQAIPNAASVINPLTQGLSEFRVSSDGTIAYATVSFGEDINDLPLDTFASIEAAAQPAVDAGLDVEYGGKVVDLDNPPNPGVSQYSSEIGLAIALVILLLAFGSVVTAGLPIGTALIGLGASAASLAVLEHFFTIGTINPTFGSMLGLGVGVDYSLLILNRYLQNRAEGQDVVAATGNAIGTAGKAVLFAGTTISIAVIALAVFSVPYMTKLGLTSAMYVVFAVAAALTVMPALIGLAGRHVEGLRLPGFRRRSEVPPDDPRSMWSHWARIQQRIPWLLAPIAIALLVVLALPSPRAELGFLDDGDQPTDLTQRQAYDLLAEGFGPGVNGPLLVVASLPAPTSQTQEEAEGRASLALANAIAGTPDVSSVTPPVPNSEGTAEVIVVTPRTGPNDPQTTELVRNLREDVIPQAVAGTDIDPDEVFLGGDTATLIDLTDRLEGRLFTFIAVVLGAAFLLLMLVFRSILVPLKAVVLNLLMFLAAYGVVVAVFQWGWGRGAVGVSQDVPIESFLPVIVFAVIFGLSTDYEVFLVSRVREAYDTIGEAHAAVVEGVATTARVIASAVLIMTAVFFSFVTNPQPLVKEIGFTLGAGILIDGFVVRLVIVPSLLHLMGRTAWWFPRWLGRIVPTISLEGEPNGTPAPPTPKPQEVPAG